MNANRGYSEFKHLYKIKLNAYFYQFGPWKHLVEYLRASTASFEIIHTQQ